MIVLLVKSITQNVKLSTKSLRHARATKLKPLDQLHKMMVGGVLAWFGDPNFKKLL